MSDGWPRDDGRPSWWSHFGMGESEKWGREWGVTAWIWRRWRNVRKSLQFGKPEKVEDPLEISDNLKQHQQTQSFPGGLKGKESACNAGYQVSIPGLGRYPEERNIYLLQYSCLENSMDRGAWQATQSMGLQRFRHDWVHARTCAWAYTHTHTHTFIHTHTVQLQINIIDLFPWVPTWKHLNASVVHWNELVSIQLTTQIRLLTHPPLKVNLASSC